MPATGTQNQKLVAAAKPLTASGAVFVAPFGTELPTTVDEDLDAAYKSLGYISEDGITNAIETDSESIVAFGGDTVLTIKSSHTETFSFKPIEVNKNVLSLIWGDKNVTGEDTSGLTVKHTADDPEACVILFAFALSGGRKMIMGCPNAKVTEIGENVYVTNDAQGFELTITAMVDEKGVSVYQITSGSEHV